MKSATGNWLLALGFAGLVPMFSGCSTPPPPSPERTELSQITTTARRAYEQGSPAQAVRLYGSALKRVRVQDDPVEIGNNAYNLAACLLSIERYGEARSLLLEAKREFARAGCPVTLVLLLEAKAARLQGRAEEALTLADQVLATLKQDDTGTYPLQVALLKTQVACDRGDAAMAKEDYARAIQALQGVDDWILKADAAGAAGRIAQLENDGARAAQEYDRQAEYCKRAKKFREMALSLGSAGQAYLTVNLYSPAVDRFYRSARSLFAQGDSLAALKRVQAALAAGEKAGDPDSLMQTRALFDEIKKQVEGETSAGQEDTRP